MLVNGYFATSLSTSMFASTSTSTLMSVFLSALPGDCVGFNQFLIIRHPFLKPCCSISNRYFAVICEFLQSFFQHLMFVYICVCINLYKSLIIKLYKSLIISTAYSSSSSETGRRCSFCVCDFDTASNASSGLVHIDLTHTLCPLMLNRCTLHGSYHIGANFKPPITLLKVDRLVL